MRTLTDLVHTLIERRERGAGKMTLLAVCPNSSAVLEAAVKVAAENNAPMLFAATLNQVRPRGRVYRLDACPVRPGNAVRCPAV